MRLLFADVEVNHRHHKNNSEEDQGGGTRAALMVSKCVVNKSDHRIQSVGISRRTHVVSEDTYDTGIFLKASDEARDHNVGKHGRKKRNRNTREHTCAGRTVDPSGIVILLIDALKTAKQYQDLKGQGIPYYVNNHDHNIRPILGACVDPVNTGTTKKLYDVVNNTFLTAPEGRIFGRGPEVNS